ncbi:hypothetical protein B0H19DRAFT_1246999 [Mycena capillaripes]|nr:hypothetical protein B0H19DRAFT_1246999 [Mycena capillaripes]
MANYQGIANTWNKWTEKIVASSPPYPLDPFDSRDESSVGNRKEEEFLNSREAATKDLVVVFETWKQENKDAVDAWLDSLDLAEEFDDVC